MLIKSDFVPTIKVVGVGGDGSRTVQEMKTSKKYEEVEFITIQKESNDLRTDNSTKTIILSDKKNSSNILEESYERWKDIAISHKEEITKELSNADLVFICCNEGKGIGTGVAPIVADVARKCGALTIAIVTEPFALEGKRKKQIAKIGVEELRKKADMVIPVYKQRIFENIIPHTPVTKAFNQIKTPIYEGVRIISDIIRMAQHINIDLADLRNIIEQGSYGFIGEGEGTGSSENRVKLAVKNALSFPLTDNSLENSSNVLLHVTGGSDLSMNEVNELCSIITSSMKHKTHIKYGLTIDDKLTGKIKVNIIATSTNTNTSGKRQNPIINNRYVGDLSDLDTPTFIRQNRSYPRGNKA